MSWLATKYAWKCRHEDVKGSVRLVLLAIALRVKKNYISTVPTSMATLMRLTFLSDDAVRRCLNTLELAGEVRRIRRGKRARYALVKMAGPLFLETPQDAVFFEEEKTPQDAGISGRKMRGNSGVSAGGVLLSNSSSTNKLTPTTDDESTAVEAFLDWFLAEFQRQRGVMYQVKPVVAEQVVRELLRGRSVERLQAMARLMFDAVNDKFIIGSDYSLHVLKHKATYLEAIAVRNERAAQQREAVG